MESALGWIGKLAEVIGGLFPRLLILTATHNAVAFVRGWKVKPLYPGLHVYWPTWTVVTQYPVVMQTVNLPQQSLLTKDGKQIVVGGMVRFQITDIVKALADTWDIDDVIVDEAQAAIRDVVVQRTVESVQTERTKVNNSLTNCLSRVLSRYGIEVDCARLTDFSTAICLNHVGVGNREV